VPSFIDFSPILPRVAAPSFDTELVMGFNHHFKTKKHHLKDKTILTDDPDDEGVSGKCRQRQNGVNDGQEDNGGHGVFSEVDFRVFRRR